MRVGRRLGMGSSATSELKLADFVLTLREVCRERLEIGVADLGLA
jgi:hypothetical protein